MKDKRIIPIIVIALVLVIGVVCCILFGKENKNIITLDINPSFQITLDNNEKVLDVKGLNDDARVITDKGIQGETLNDVLSVIVDGVLEHDFIDGDHVDILLYSEGNIDNGIIKNDVEKQFQDREINAYVIVVENISSEDEKLAKEYGISPAKAAYINSVVKENENYKVEDFVNKTVGDILETKETGKYCDEGYELEGDWCRKEINRVPASNGNVCPDGSRQYNGKCYKVTSHTNEVEYFCNDDETLNGTECVRRTEVLAEYDDYKCDTGTMISCAKRNGEAEKPGEKCFVCVDESKVEHPTYICVVKKDGNCYGGRGKPYYEGKCINGDIEYNGQCYEKRQYEYTCKDGSIVNSADSYCPNDPAITNVIPIYTCNQENATLVGDQCVIEESRKASERKLCPSGTISIEEMYCLDLNTTFEKEDGYYCENDKASLRNNQCVIYDEVKAKQY